MMTIQAFLMRSRMTAERKTWTEVFASGFSPARVTCPYGKRGRYRASMAFSIMHGSALVLTVLRKCVDGHVPFESLSTGRGNTSVPASCLFVRDISRPEAAM